MSSLPNSSWFPRGRSQEDEPHWARLSACILLANVSLAKQVTRPSPECVGEGTPQGGMVHGVGGGTDGTVYHRRPHRLSEPTNSLSQVTGSGSVPSTQPPCGSSNPEIGTREKTPRQKGRGKNLSIISEVVLTPLWHHFQDIPSRVPISKITPLPPCLLSIIASLFRGEYIHV